MRWYPGADQRFFGTQSPLAYLDSAYRRAYSGPGVLRGGLIESSWHGVQELLRGYIQEDGDDA